MIGSPLARTPGTTPDLAPVLKAFRTAIVAIAAFSGVSNVLMLTGSLYMLKVYDRGCCRVA